MHVIEFVLILLPHLRETDLTMTVAQQENDGREEQSWGPGIDGRQHGQGVTQTVKRRLLSLIVASGWLLREGSQERLGASGLSQRGQSV